MEKWTVWKGWHFSLSNIWERFIPRIGSGPVTYKFKLPKETWFPYADKDDLDINKLAGFSFLNHHTNSVRIGWTPDFDKEGYFTLYFYLYNGGIRTIKKFATIKADTDYSLTISFFKAVNYVNFYMVGDSQIQPVKANEVFVLPTLKLGYSLWWYFGGNKTAPKDMIIWLKSKGLFG